MTCGIRVASCGFCYSGSNRGMNIPAQRTPPLRICGRRGLKVDQVFVSPLHCNMMKKNAKQEMYKMGGTAIIRASNTRAALSYRLNLNSMAKPTKMISESDRKALQYHPRIRIRALQDPVAHNFPYSFDSVMLEGNSISSTLYVFQYSRYTKIIFHRTFKGGI